MGWVDALRGTLVGIDTAPLIYYIETNPAYIQIVDPFFDALDLGELRVVTSFVTLVEVLVVPLRNSDTAVADHYRRVLLQSPGLVTLPVDATIAEEAARLRAAHNLRTPDAIQMATALVSGAQRFLTNDTRLPSLPNLQVLTLDSLKSAP
ncbi:MAG TPA: PIN domain-containing protein [Ktedonobacterales bacterium]|nr:PIN domain-containing protein [Ktedonobacterales bacterium]